MMSRVEEKIIGAFREAERFRKKELSDEALMFFADCDRQHLDRQLKSMEKFGQIERTQKREVRFWRLKR